MNMLNNVFLNKKYIIKFFIISLFLNSLTYSQADRMIQMKAGDLITYVDMYRGNFSVFDSMQSNSDLSSFLFGNTAIPSSFFEIYVDEKKQTIDQMAVEYPLGLSLNSQIDGIYLAGDQKDVRVEFAFFPLDLLGNSDFNSLSLAISVSNLSPSQTRRVAIRILLDTDISETQNKSLVYLPTGENITNGRVLGKNKIPLFLFFGQKIKTETTPIGEGFYLYPFITEKLPDMISIGNWKKVSTSSMKDTKSIIDTPLAVNNRSNKDVGVSVVFGDFVLNPKSVENVGVIISKHLSSLWPILGEEEITKGVFNTNRFEVEEVLEKTNPQNIDNFLEQDIIEKYIPAMKKMEIYQKRSAYRKNTLGTSSNKKNYSYLLQENNYNSSNMSQQFSNVLRGKDGSWRYIYQLNQDMQQKGNAVNKVLQLNMSDNSYDIPPYQGIQKDQFYSEE